MLWTILLFVFIIITYLELYKFINDNQIFRLIILIPLILYIIEGTHLAHYFSPTFNLIFKVFGIVAILFYYGYAYTKPKGN